MNPFWQTRDEATVRLFCGDSLSVLQGMPTESIHCVVTSPPYWALRDYGVEGQLGGEAAPEEYVSRMVVVMREVRRVLRKDGTLWLNLGDSYAGSSGTGGKSLKQISNSGSFHSVKRQLEDGLKPKDLVGIPWRVALALQADGWWLRQDILWEKLSPMPESVTDRCTKSHEYIFLLSKSPDYYYDAQANKDKPDSPNLRSVWTLSTKPYPGSHFATFPPELPMRCIKAGTSQAGCCPECGTGWERVVSREPIYRERPNKLTKRTGEEGTGNYCPNDVDGVAYNTLGWKPGCNCYKVGMIKAYPSKSKDESDFKYSSRVQKWLEAWHKLKPTYDALKEDNLPAVVLDPFIGSGTTCVAAIDLDRDSVGIDISEKYLRNNAIPRVSGRLQRYRSKTHLVPRG